MKTHEIRQYDISIPLEFIQSGFYSKFVLIDERKFVNLFSERAYTWFDKVIVDEYPQAVLVNDKTLAGYHWEFENLYWELH